MIKIMIEFKATFPCVCIPSVSVFQPYSIRIKYTVKPVHTGMPWGQSFIPVWTGSGYNLYS